jgi:adenylate cyclase
MRIGDSAQRRLMNMQEQIKAVNDELQEKNDRLSSTLSEIGLLNGILDGERQKAESLLLNILPRPIAYRLQSGEEAIADNFDNVTVLFADIVGFTQLASTVGPTVIVKILNELFSRFDALLDVHAVEKIKTIGDNYMVAAGIPMPQRTHAQIAARMVLDMQRELDDYVLETGYAIAMRIGMHCGPVVAGVIGAKKFVYDLWGDTVNIASRMESHGEPGKVHCSESVYRELGDYYAFAPRGTVEVKGKGLMQTYFLLGERED